MHFGSVLFQFPNPVKGIDYIIVHTVATKEVVLRGGPPSVDGEQSNRKVKQINSEKHQLIVQR